MTLSMYGLLFRGAHTHCPAVLLGIAVIFREASACPMIVTQVTTDIFVIVFRSLVLLEVHMHPHAFLMPVLSGDCCHSQRRTGKP